MPPSSSTYRHGDQLHDVRLIPPALCLWGTTIVAAYGGVPVLAGVVCFSLAVVLAVVLAAMLRRSGRCAHQSRRQWKSKATTPLLLACILTILFGGLVLIPQLLLAERFTQVSDGTSSTSATTTARVVTGRVASRPLHSDTGIRFTLRTAYGEMTIYAHSPEWRALLLGQRITVVVKAARPPAHHLTLGEWRAVFLRESHPPQGMWALSTAVSQRWEEALNLGDRAGLTPSLHALLRGMTIGDTSGLPDTLRRDYRASGLTHLTAVSGTNVSYLLLLAGVFLRHTPPRRKAAVYSLLLVIFVALVGPEPAVLRATVSGAVGVLALWHGGRRAAFPALGAGILTLLILSPTFAVSPGFALSIAATAALIWAAPHLQEWFERAGLPTIVAAVLAVTVVAAVFTVPLTLYFFGTASVFGVLANILVAPVVPVITALGLLGVVASLVFPPLGAMLVLMNAPLLWWVEKVGVMLGGSRWAELAIPVQLSPGYVPAVVPSLLATALIAAVVLAWQSPRGRRVVGCSLAAVLLLTVGHAGWSQRQLTACATQAGTLTLTMTAEGKVTVRGVPYSVHTTQSSITQSSTTRATPAVTERAVVVVEGNLSAATLPQLDHLAALPLQPLLVHRTTAPRHSHPWASRTPSSPPTVSPSPTVLPSPTVPLAPTLSFTPHGTPVVEMAPGSTAIITASNQICGTGVAR